MRKIRFELLEQFVRDDNGQDIANLAFKQIEENINKLKTLGIEVEMPEIVILNETEYKKTF